MLAFRKKFRNYSYLEEEFLSFSVILKNLSPILKIKIKLKILIQSFLANFWLVRYENRNSVKFSCFYGKVSRNQMEE